MILLLSTEIGGMVTQWRDKSGNCKSFVSFTASDSPITGVRRNAQNVLDLMDTFDGMIF